MASYLPAALRQASQATGTRATVQLRLAGYTRTLDFAAQKALLSADLFPGVSRAIRAPVMLPTKRERWALLKSPHVHKKAQEHFERHTHYRLVVVTADTVAAGHRWLEYAGRTMPGGVNARARVMMFQSAESIYRSPALDGALFFGQPDGKSNGGILNIDADRVPAIDFDVVRLQRQAECLRFVEENLRHLDGAQALIQESERLMAEASDLMASPQWKLDADEFFEEDRTIERRYNEEGEERFEGLGKSVAPQSLLSPSLPSAQRSAAEGDTTTSSATSEGGSARDERSSVVGLTDSEDEAIQPDHLTPFLDPAAGIKDEDIAEDVIKFEAFLKRFRTGQDTFDNLLQILETPETVSEEDRYKCPQVITAMVEAYTNISGVPLETFIGGGTSGQGVW